MSTKLVVIILIFSILLFLYLIKLVRDKNISVKYALVWLIPLFIFIISILFTGFFAKVANLLGFETLVSFVFSTLIGFLLLICLVLTVIVTRLRKRQKIIIQELSILKKYISDDKKQ